MGEFYAVFPFWSGGCPRLPHKPGAGGANYWGKPNKEETRHGEPNPPKELTALSDQLNFEKDPSIASIGRQLRSAPRKI